jgi:predicted O-methyltransferase YrrM
MGELESRFTPANQFCAHPEYWTSLDQDSTENEVSEMLAGLVRAIQPEYVVETGTAYGVTTMLLGAALKQNGHGRLVSLDTDGQMIENARKGVREFENLIGDIPVEIRQQNSMDFVPDQDIDFAFFDSWQEGRHLEYSRYKELGRIKSGTIIAFHDTAPHHQVLKHIKALEEAGEVRPIYFRTPRGVTIAQVC